MQKIPSLGNKGWLNINDIAGVSDELITGYLTTLENQSIMGGLKGESQTGKLHSLIHDLNLGNNNSNALIDVIGNSLTTLFQKYYPSTEINVTTKEDTKKAKIDISIQIIITYNNAEYNVGAIIPTQSGKIGEYSIFTKTANPYQKTN